MNLSRRDTMQLSATAVAALSVPSIRTATAAPSRLARLAVESTPSAAPPRSVGAPQPLPDNLAPAQLRNISPLPLNPDGSAIEHSESEAGPITGVLWKSKGTPDIEFDYRKMKIKVDGRGTTRLAGTLTFADLEKLPPHSQVTLLQCGAATPKGIVKWTGVRFSDFAQSVGAQSFAFYGRFVASDGYIIDEDMKTLMHPQVMLAWLMNEKPLPPENGAPLRLVVPFRYGARSLKAIREIQFTATAFPAAMPA